MSVQSIPQGYHTITPYFTVKGGHEFIQFLKRAFGAEEVAISAGEDGALYNAEIRLGNSMLMVGEAQENFPAKPMVMYVYVADPDSLHAQAVANGAKLFRPMTDQFYGDRVGAVEDAWGNQWWIAKRVKNVSAKEVSAIKDSAKK